MRIPCGWNYWSGLDAWAGLTARCAGLRGDLVAQLRAHLDAQDQERRAGSSVARYVELGRHA
jgi:hypothetical protein